MVGFSTGGLSQTSSEPALSASATTSATRRSEAVPRALAGGRLAPLQWLPGPLVHHRPVLQVLDHRLLVRRHTDG